MIAPREQILYTAVCTIIGRAYPKCIRACALLLIGPHLSILHSAADFKEKDERALLRTHLWLSEGCISCLGPGVMIA